MSRTEAEVPVVTPGEDDLAVRILIVTEDVPTCRICGCTDEEACLGGCVWVEDPEGIGDLCSSCEDAL